jgi:hypothetical protein
MNGKIMHRPHSRGINRRQREKENTKNASKQRNAENILNVKEIKT